MSRGRTYCGEDITLWELDFDDDDASETLSDSDIIPPTPEKCRSLRKVSNRFVQVPMFYYVKGPCELMPSLGIRCRPSVAVVIVNIN